MFNFNVTGISVIERDNAMDLIVVSFDNLPAPQCFDSAGNLQMMFYASKNTGREYCEKNFPGVTISVIQN